MNKVNIKGIECLKCYCYAVPFNNVFMKENEKYLKPIRPLIWGDIFQLRYLLICGHKDFLDKMIRRWNWFLREKAPKGAKTYIFQAPLAMFVYPTGAFSRGERTPVSPIGIVYHRLQLKKVEKIYYENELEFARIDKGELIARSPKEYCAKNNIIPDKDFVYDDQDLDSKLKDILNKDIEEIDNDKIIDDVIGEINFENGE